MEHAAKSTHEQFVQRVRRLDAHPPNRQANEIYRLSKEIDGRREGAGTFPLFGARVTKLSLLGKGHRGFYEPLGTSDDLLRLSRVNTRLAEGGAPTGALNQLSVAIRVFESAYDAPLGELPLPAPSEREQGVHQVSLNGTLVRAGDMLILFRNSWGEWGYEGSGVFSREYLERYMVEAWLSRKDAIGPSRFTRPLLDVNAANPKVYARVWMLRFPLLAALNGFFVNCGYRAPAQQL
jgi:hypothetical protein